MAARQPKALSARRAEAANPREESVTLGVRQYTELLEAADPQSIAVVLALWKASHVQMLANSRAIDALDLPISVKESRLAVLRTLHFAPGGQLALNEISKSTDLSPAMVTHLIGGLSKAGMVRQHGSTSDRRVKIAQITEEGEEAFQRVLPVLAQRMSSACEHMTDEEKATLLRLLQRLLDP